MPFDVQRRQQFAGSRPGLAAAHSGELRGQQHVSATVRSSSRLKNWKIIPTRRRRNRATPVSLSRSTRSPATVTAPLVGLSRPAMRLSSVDFPLPDGPMTATASPGASSRLTPSTAGRPSLS